MAADDFSFLDKSTQLVKRALRDSLAPGAAGYLDLFHDDAVFEFPYAPGGAVRQEGKTQMAAYLHSIEGGNALDSFVLTAAYPMRDGQTTVLEYESRGHDLASGRHMGRVRALFTPGFEPLMVLATCQQVCEQALLGLGGH